MRNILKIAVFSMGLTAGLMSLATRLPASGPPTIASALRELGIGLDHNSLVRALADRRPKVRSFAASQLASQRDREALPALVQAMQREHVQQTRLSIAASLTALGDLRGSDELGDFCANTHLSDDLRMQAATTLASVGHDYRCAPYILSITDAGGINVEEGLLYLADVPESEKDSAAFGPLLVKIALHNADPGNRRLARQILEKLGGKKSKEMVPAGG